ncbi:hypothetical protein OPKNFCMD_0967 [Methylobacterium crusticola]|uniref:Porin n=1 Tax=Methylobacterium crusticola TaxID=1697972 RepID=A0ABQ4QU07_9HYPH|nr:hypothetical protein [Methylobacterium crusticola]GJD48250.1 hypothetical protein OPKNFCMD_0967 [Methylobacterium crusticola]
MRQCFDDIAFLITIALVALCGLCVSPARAAADRADPRLSVARKAPPPCPARTWPYITTTCVA